MSNRDLPPEFRIFSLIFIYLVIGELAILPFCICLCLQLIAEVLRIYDNVREFREKVRLEEARRRRSREISIISTAVSTELGRITTKETAKLEAARAEARKRRSEDVATIASLIMKQILAVQAEQKAKEEAARLSAQRKAETAAVVEQKRHEKQRLAVLEQEKRKAEERERQAALERRSVAFDLVQNTLPMDLRDLDPLGAGFTCIGETRAGGRCGQWMISHSDLRAAADRLKIMRSKDPGDSFELPQLLELANWMLCPRWHRDKIPQGKDISRRWCGQLQPARDALSALNEARKVPVTPLKGSGGSLAFGSLASSSPWSGTSSTVSSFGLFSMPQTPLSVPDPSPPSSTSSDAGDLSKRNEPLWTIPSDPRANLTSSFQALAKR
jgi:hypothetical protein